MTKMTEKILQLFNAQSGAYSTISETEATHDRAITVDEDEKQVLFSRYPQSSFTRAGGGAPDGKSDKKKFNVYNMDKKSFEVYELTIKLPKKSGNELRLYFNKCSGYFPKTGQYSVIFTRPDSPHPFICACDKIYNS